MKWCPAKAVLRRKKMRADLNYLGDNVKRRIKTNGGMQQGHAVKLRALRYLLRNSTENFRVIECEVLESQPVPGFDDLKEDRYVFHRIFVHLDRERLVEALAV